MNLILDGFTFYRRYTHKKGFNLSERLIIPDVGTATENISAFLDFCLKPVVPTVPHIFEDTRDLLSRLSYIQGIPRYSKVFQGMQYFFLLMGLAYTQTYPMKKELILRGHF